MLTYLLITSIVVIVVLRFVRFYIKFYKNKRVLQRVPAPPERFFLGHLNVFTNNPDDIFARIRLYSKKYYPIYRFSTPYITIANCLEPNDIELVLSSTKHLSKSKIYTFLCNWLGTGLLTSTGTTLIYV
ncbi:cytochrome P450 4c21-like [Zophobas morio]|uniref:cytochrome P450 4c21-like n=1 Tax=Zophobas morio TaxID=2755281 RepID=UPI0030837376